jgi:DNA gyrase/topoisomerase IV subunit B
MADSSKEIIALSDFEHVLERPTMYVGSVKASEEKVPIIKGGRIVSEPREISVGFYKLFNEILDNAVDEAVRLKGKMKKIRVEVDSASGTVTVADTGEGFYKGTDINKKTGLTNIETAVSQLRAGSNFKNDASEETLIGTNGVGAAVVNMLSSFFSIETVNSTHRFYREWNNFKPGKLEKSKRAGEQRGTVVRFCPRADVFPCKWDRDILTTSLVFKRFIMENTPVLSKTALEFVFDGKQVDLSGKFFPDDAYVGKTALGVFAVYQSFQDSTSVSFINSAMCTGIHQRVFNEAINAELEDPLGHHFYETFIVLNLPPKLVKFADQNKTKYAGTRDDVEKPIQAAFGSKFGAFFSTKTFTAIKKRVDERKASSEVRNLRNLKKKTNAKYSTKYTPPSARMENLFIVEGESAAGSILQRRNTKTDGVYALKGKIKNVRTMSDLTGNKVILELMQILDLDIDPTKRQHSYKRIIIATDADEDGAHIFSLLVNFFYRWFSYVIDEGRLYYLQIPLMSVNEGKGRAYFFDKKEFEDRYRNRAGTFTGHRFLKGLGSLDLDDWEFVMENKRLWQISKGKDSAKYIDMAFGDDSELRKSWLSRGDKF